MVEERTKMQLKNLRKKPIKEMGEKLLNSGGKNEGKMVENIGENDRKTVPKIG